MNKAFKLYNGNCLDLMRDLPDASIDLILCDLPYGTTKCPWDTVLPFNLLWDQYTRIIKPSRSIVLFGTEPFSSRLRLSNIDHYKYDWYWKKTRPGGFVNAKLKPLKDIETISVFSSGSTANGAYSNMLYIPQGTIECNSIWKRKNANKLTTEVSPTRKSFLKERVITHSGYPRQILEFSNSNRIVLHPTQKPVELMEYLIKTYSNKNDVVLDNTMGSGTTGVASMNLRRKFIGMELDTKYFEIAETRIKQAYESQKTMLSDCKMRLK